MTIMYSTGCPKCRVLEAKLKKAGIEYETVSDTDAMGAIGLTEVPYLSVDGKLMDFGTAIKWLNENTDAGFTCASCKL